MLNDLGFVTIDFSSLPFGDIVDENYPISQSNRTRHSHLVRSI